MPLTLTNLLISQWRRATDTDSCAICLEGYAGKSHRLGLRCGHVFHDACACCSVWTWHTDDNYVKYSEVFYLRFSKCPLCRADTVLNKDTMVLAN